MECVLATATCRPFKRQSWQAQGCFYLVAQQYYYFSIGWLCIFYKLYSDGKIHIREIPFNWRPTLTKLTMQINSSSRRRENTGLMVSNLEALGCTCHNTGLQSIGDNCSASNAFTSAKSQMQRTNLKSLWMRPWKESGFSYCTPIFCLCQRKGKSRTQKIFFFFFFKSKLLMEKSPYKVLTYKLKSRIVLING